MFHIKVWLFLLSLNTCFNDERVFCGFILLLKALHVFFVNNSSNNKNINITHVQSENWKIKLTKRVVILLLLSARAQRWLLLWLESVSKCLWENLLVLVDVGEVIGFYDEFIHVFIHPFIHLFMLKVTHHTVETNDKLSDKFMVLNNTQVSRLYEI